MIFNQLLNLNISTDVSDLTIGPGAFYNNRSLENLILPKGVTSIGNEAFRYIDVYPAAVEYAHGEGHESVYAG